MLKKPACFGRMYSYKAIECQICTFSILCWESHNMSPVKSVITNGYMLAIMSILKEKQKTSIDVVKDELKLRFGDKELNIYYYLGQLKKLGSISVEIRGRQRYYSLR